MPKPQRHCRKCLLLRILALALYLFALTWLSLTSSPPSISGPLGWDKFLHAAAYGLLAVLTIRLIAQVSGRVEGAWWQAWLFTVGFGILMEVFQVTFTPNRMAEFTDVLADVVGATIACVLSRHNWVQKFIQPVTTEEKHG